MLNAGAAWLGTNLEDSGQVLFGPSPDPGNSRTLLGLQPYNLDIWILLFEISGCAHDCPSCTH